MGNRMPSDSLGLTTYEEAEAAVGWANSYTRLGVVMGLRAHMSGAEWWRLLGTSWACCDNIASFRAELARELRRASEVELMTMMTDDAREAWSRLPDQFTVYRGCYVNNRKGLSWSLDREIAAAFPLLHRYRQPTEPLLLTATARKRSCVLMLERNEQEAIAWGVRGISMARIGRVT